MKVFTFEGKEMLVNNDIIGPGYNSVDKYFPCMQAALDSTPSTVKDTLINIYIVTLAIE